MKVELKKKMAQAKIEVEDGLYYARLPIFAEWAQLSTPYGQKFAETLSIIDAKLR